MGTLRLSKGASFTADSSLLKAQGYGPNLIPKKGIRGSI
ncbi:hypothetical protein ES703_31994 [subsurface metagenome]